MLLLLYGEDTYQGLQKLNEIIERHKKAHKSGLNLTYFDFTKDTYEDFEAHFRNYSMLKEKKLFIVKNAYENKDFKQNFLESSKKMLDSKDIIVFVEGSVSEKDKFIKFVKKSGKSQHFPLLEGGKLKNWIIKEFGKAQVDSEAINELISFVGNDLWRLSGEIQKLTSYKKGAVIKKEDVKLLVRSNIDTDIFKTIDALSLKNKKEALSLIHKHLEKGDSPLYLLSMINFQFRNLLLVKSKQEQGPVSSFSLSRELKIHPYVARKSTDLARRFSFEELKKIYQKIFQADLSIKTGAKDPVTTLDLLVSEI
ncbi:DNA polymerase III subunit delta [Patescibacteria group bacterium]